jgi:hypothetical protein
MLPSATLQHWFSTWSLQLRVASIVETAGHAMHLPTCVCLSDTAGVCLHCMLGPCSQLFASIKKQSGMVMQEFCATKTC